MNPESRIFFLIAPSFLNSTVLHQDRIEIKMKLNDRHGISQKNRGDINLTIITLILNGH